MHARTYLPTYLPTYLTTYLACIMHAYVDVCVYVYIHISQEPERRVLVLVQASKIFRKPETKSPKRGLDPRLQTL